jgi:hypothetical protein
MSSTPADRKIIGADDLKCGYENVRALSIILAGHWAELPTDPAKRAAVLVELHPYFADADVLSTATRLAGLS